MSTIFTLSDLETYLDYSISISAANKDSVGDPSEIISIRTQEESKIQFCLFKGVDPGFIFGGGGGGGGGVANAVICRVGPEQSHGGGGGGGGLRHISKFPTLYFDIN